MSKIILSYLFKTNLANLRTAILEDNTDKICRILDIERDYLNRVIDGDGNTALLLAIQHASPLTVRLLLEHGAHPDKPNEIAYHTPLGMIASITYEDFYSYKAQRTLEMAKILLEYGAYVDKPSLRVYRNENNVDYFGKETPLMTAVRKGNLPLVTLLITKRANVNTMERQSQIRPIHFAISNGDEIMYDLLIASGALTSVSTDDDNTLLHWFCYKKENDPQLSFLQKLLNNTGCNINAQNREQLTPLMIAAKYDMIETCRLLLENHADIDKRDSNGYQAVNLATSGGDCSKLLIQKRTSCINSPDGKVVWRKRIDSTPRVSNAMHVEAPSTKGGSELTTKSNNLPRKRQNEQHEHVWDKLLQSSTKRKVLTTLYNKRGRSIEHRNTFRC